MAAIEEKRVGFNSRVSREKEEMGGSDEGCLCAERGCFNLPIIEETIG